VPDPRLHKRAFSCDDELPECRQLKFLRIDGSLFFGSVNHVQRRIAQIADNERIYNILIVASGLNYMDLAGAEALVAENNRLKQQNGGLYFVGLHSSIYEFAAKSCFIRKIGNDHFFDSKTQAIRQLYARLDRSICSTCMAQIFRECQ
jgi:SulP family sulfate permease